MFVDKDFNIKISFVNDFSKYLNSLVKKLIFKINPEFQRWFMND